MALVKTETKKNTAPRMPLLKKLFWAYFLLLVFEGALRKWLLPQLAAPLLLIRDPIAIFIIWEAFRTHKWPRKWSTAIQVLTVGFLILSVTQLILGDSIWVIALYGLRSYLLPFPVAFIMGENLDSEDLRKFGVCTLWLLLPEVVLAIAQYYAPPTSFLNKGTFVGLDQIGYVAGHTRASGTFSFVSGMIFFLPLAGAFILNGLADAKFTRKWLLWAGLGALILSIPVTGSRSVAILLGAMVVCMAVAALSGISQFGSTLRIIVAVLLLAMLVSHLPVFSDASDSFVERFNEAETVEGGAEGSVMRRLVEPITQPLAEGLDNSKLLGSGVGYGSNVSAQLLTGTAQFLAGEGEFGRILNEFGFPCGLAFMFFRLSLVGVIAFKAFQRVRERAPLAWFLIPAMFTAVVVSALEQPTIQGFMVILLGFSLAALRRPPSEVSESLNRLAMPRPRPVVAAMNSRLFRS